MSSRNKRLAQLLTVLAALALFISFRSCGRHAPVVRSTPAPRASQVAPPPPAARAVAPSPSPKSENVSETESGRQGFLCRLYARLGIFELPTEYFSVRANGADGSVTMTAVLPEEDSFCLSSGASAQIAWVAMDPEAHMPLGFEGRISAHVQASDRYESVERILALTEPRGEDAGAIERALPLLGRFFGAESFKHPVRRVRFELGANAWPDHSPAVARYPNPYVGRVGGRGLAQAIRKSATLIDMRVAPQFNAAHLEGSISIPVPDIPFDTRYLSIRELKAWADRASVYERIPRDHPVIVFSASPESRAPDNLANLLVLQGYPDVQIFREGFLGFQRIATETPSDPPAGITRVSAREVASLLSAGTPTVDARRRPNVTMRTLKGWDAPWIEAVDAAGRSPHSADPRSLTPEAITRLQDRWFAPAELLQYKGDLIVFGSDEFDWRPLKAAVLIAARGKARKIYWFRGGTSEWSFEGRLGETRRWVTRVPPQVPAALRSP